MFCTEIEVTDNYLYLNLKVKAIQKLSTLPALCILGKLDWVTLCEIFVIGYLDTFTALGLMAFFCYEMHDAACKVTFRHYISVKVT